VQDKAIIYANSDHDDFQYLKESVISANSFRQYLPDAKFVLYTNNPDFKNDVFNEIIIRDFIVPAALEGRVHKRGQMLIKHQAMIETKARRNLVLGCDTLAVDAEVANLFDLLDRFDIAAAHAPTRICVPIPDVPSAYPEFNCDVILFRRNRGTKRLFKQWKRDYAADRFGHPHDQGVFRYLAYHSKLHIATLPFEYNDRMGMFGQQAPDDERKLQKSVILQNRDKIADNRSFLPVAKKP